MSVLRQMNWLGQARVDVPHLRSLESSIAGDFDALVGRLLGASKALVVRGFELTSTGAGALATSIQVQVADAIVVNLNASESGSFLWVPKDRAPETLNAASNSKVLGNFVPSQTNYVGVDFIRQADATTTDIVQFYAPSSSGETARNVPLARTLDYQLVISTTPFSSTSNVVPVALVVTDAANLIVSVMDARSMLTRLGVGGDAPNGQSVFAWPQGRTESSITFSGGDKGIWSVKDWFDAVMHRLWELGGGTNWYSPTADRDVRLTRNAASTFTSTGDNFEFVAGDLHWKGLSIVFTNSNTAGVYYNLIQDQLVDATSLTDLANGECLFVELNRTSNATLVAQKTTLNSFGTSATPGSRWIIAWRSSTGDVYTRDSNFPVNTVVLPATTVAIGGVRLSYAAGTPATPTVIPLDANNALNIGTGSYLTVGNNTALTATAQGIGTAIRGIGGSGGGHGLHGSSSGTGTGVFGDGGSGGGFGVHGRATGSFTAAVRGEATGSGGVGVQGNSTSGAAIYGAATTGPGGLFETGGNLGIESRVESVSTPGFNGAGIFKSAATMALYTENDSTTEPTIRVRKTGASGYYGLDVVSAGSTTAAYVQNTGTGRALSVYGASGTQPSLLVVSSNVHCMELSDVTTGASVRFLNSTSAGIGWPGGKTMKKVLGGTDFRIYGTPLNTSPSVVVDVTNNTLNSGTMSGAGGIIYGTGFTLPLNALITSVFIRLNHSGNVPPTPTVNFSMVKAGKTASGWTNLAISTTATTALTLSASPTTETITLVMNGTANNRKILTNDESVSIRVDISGNTGNFVNMLWVEVNYTMFEALSW